MHLLASRWIPAPGTAWRWRLVLALGCCAAPLAAAQTPPPSADLPAAAEPHAGFAPVLRPRKTSPEAARGQPYRPIEKTDDQAQVPEIEMFVGESRVFPSPGVARIAVGNGKVLTAAALDEREVIIFANQTGTSSLFVWNEDGRYQRVKINVVPGDTSRYAREIAAFLSTIPNARSSIIGDKIVVEGDHLNDIDLRKIEDLRKHYPQIINFTNPMGWEQMVLLDVKVVEFPVNELREIGLRWTPQGGASVGAIWSPGRRGHQPGLSIGIQNPVITSTEDGPIPLPHGLNVLSAVNMGINARLDMLARDGKASVLAQPQLSARNGSKAEFLAGGEYPYSVSTINGPTVVFKPYGIKLKITPRVDRNGVIRAEIDSEVSNIDTSFSTPAGPALSTRRTLTEFNVQDGETMVLAGLLSRKNSHTVDKVPLLGDLPVLGALFRSRRFQNEETELVVFVTPTVINSRSPGLEQRVQDTTERLRQRHGTASLLSGPGPAPSHPPRLAPLPPASAHASIADTPAPLLPASHNPLAQAKAQEQTDTAASSLPAAPLISQWRVVHDGLVLRAQPLAGSAALLQLGRGSLVQAAYAPEADSAPPGWRAVRAGGLQGWVRDEGLRPVAQTDQLAPPTEGPHARQARMGRSISTPDTSGPAAGTTAQLPADALAHGGLRHPAPGAYRVMLDGLALRVTPDINAPVLQHLAIGSLLHVLGQAPQAQFSAVRAGERLGWVETQWLAPLPPATQGQP